jgi:hypothetical protein
MKNSLLFVLILLTLISCAVHPKDTVGEVAGHNIPSKYYFNVLREKIAEFSVNNGRTPNMAERKKIENNAWKQIVETIVYKKMYSENNITVSNEEIENYLIENVPSFLKNNPKLKYHNQFSESLYLKSVKTDSPLDLSKLRREVYYIILNQKLKNKIIHDYSPSQDEINREVKRYFAEGDVGIYQFYPEKFKINISENEIKKYYTNHIDEYETATFVELEYVKFPVKLGENDFLQAKHIADSLYLEFKKGVSFSLVVNQKSELYFGEEKPFTYIDSLNSVVKKHLKELDENEFSKPFLYKNSYFIFNLQRRTKNMVKYMILEIPVKPTDKTLEDVKNKVIDFKELADEIGFEKAAIETNRQFVNSGKVYLYNPMIKGLGRSNSVVLRAIRRRDKYIPEFHPYLNEYILFFVKSKQLNGFKKISDCRNEIYNKLMLNKMKRIAAEFNERKIEKMIQSKKMKYFRCNNVKQNNFDDLCKNFNDLKKYLFSNLKINRMTKPIVVNNSIVIAKWIELTDNQSNNIPKEILKKSIETLKENYFKKYVKNSFKNAKIHDRRKNK